MQRWARPGRDKSQYGAGHARVRDGTRPRPPTVFVLKTFRIPGYTQNTHDIYYLCLK